MQRTTTTRGRIHAGIDTSQGHNLRLLPREKSRVNMCRLTPRAVCIVGLIALTLGMGGCSRPFWRQQADQDSYELTSEKLVDPRWDLPRIDVEPDPRSRFFDPYDPDCEPLPPDDPAANEYMHLVAGKRGYKSWHTFGEAFSIENPQWLNSFGLTPEQVSSAMDGQETESLPGIEGLTLIQAIELSNIHSRTYQTQIENVYLQALALTLERFQFDVRYLGFGREPSSNLTYTNTPDGTDSLGVNSRFGVSQLLPGGGQWVVELANNTLWLFSGGNQSNSASVLSYSLVQPLLFGAGRKVILENLTQSERNLLYATRDLSQFRRSFFTDTVNSFLTLLQQQQRVVNQQDNLRRLQELTEMQRANESQVPSEISERLLGLPPELRAEDDEDGTGELVLPENAASLKYVADPLEPRGLRYDAIARALYWAGPMTAEQATLLRGLSNDVGFQTVVNELIDRLQTQVVSLVVAQLEQQLASERNSLRSNERAFQDLLDGFKLSQLGLPPDMPVSVDLSLLQQFQLIDPRLYGVEATTKEFVLLLAEMNDNDPDLADLRVAVSGLKRLEDTVRQGGFELVQSDFDRVQILTGEQQDNTLIDGRTIAQRFETAEERSRTLNDVANDRRIFRTQLNNLNAIRQLNLELEAELQSDDLSRNRRIEIFQEIKTQREKLVKTSQTLQVTQIGLRVELITLERFTMSMREAIQLGLDNRVDLMNARAQVMDARRKVEIAANRLEAVLDVVVEGDVGSLNLADGGHFDANKGSHRVGLQFTAPLDQVAERNAYRAALINYQRARRDYMLFEDQVKLGIRESWRQLNVLKKNFENGRVNVRLAALQYDSAVEDRSAPGSQSRDATTLLRALERVLDAQNSLIGDWISYERNRLNIYRNMGIMEIDANGVWLDDYYQSRAQLIERNDESGEPGNSASREPGFGNGRLSQEGRRTAGISRPAISGPIQRTAARTPVVTSAENAPTSDGSAGLGRTGDGGLFRAADGAGLLLFEQEDVPQLRDRDREEGSVHDLRDGTGTVGQSSEFNADQRR